LRNAIARVGSLLMSDIKSSTSFLTANNVQDFTTNESKFDFPNGNILNSLVVLHHWEEDTQTKMRKISPQKKAISILD
jgi:hypothetical protein